MIFAGHGIPRALVFSAFAICVTEASTVARAAADAGMIVGVSGQPQVQRAEGRTVPARRMDTLTPGSKILLKAGETVSFCHETSGRTWRIEGAGVAFIDDMGVKVDTGGPKLTDAGKCDAAPAPSETGGVLSRGLRPAASPK